MSTETKPWYQSITILAASVVGFLQFVPEIITKIDEVIPADLAANPIVLKVLSIIGVIVAIYGRFTAKTSIK